ncbi:Prolidase [Granulibacter bethesdensis]|uniref:Prolidase n=1 Tax=Granulibacter bethesdensis TaxID=364410 RepID=A0AAC9KDU3_9PROT|nr:Prolidase [Granulibacter bethesdensis]APH61923.1 Prolidase [Granulibacter bethesdensis]
MSLSQPGICQAHHGRLTHERMMTADIGHSTPIETEEAHRTLLRSFTSIWRHDVKL